MDSLIEIRKSTDYGWFKFLPTNRTVGTSDKVKTSVETFDVTPYVPIIVTADGFIIDGQNRYEVCKSGWKYNRQQRKQVSQTTFNLEPI